MATLRLFAIAATAYLAQAQFDPEHATGKPGLDIQIPLHVTAGVDTSVTLDLTGIAPQYVTNGDDAFRVRLYDSVANYPICTLIDKTAQQPTTFSVNIPPNVGPPGAYYALALDYAESPDVDADLQQLEGGQQSEVSWAQLEVKYSNLFYLSMPPNEQSAWIPYETTVNQEDGYQVGGLFLYEPDSYVPCSSHNCLRSCAQEYGSPQGSICPSPSATYTEAYLKCASTCSGVRLPANPKTTGDPNTPPELPIPPAINETCSATSFLTPCGDNCCSPDQVCLPWGSCVPAQGNQAVQTTVMPIITPTPTATSLIAKRTTY